MKRSLDLGCGKFPKNKFNADIVFGIDVRTDLASNIFNADLVIEPIPFEDNYFDYVTAHDFIEHIPRLIYLESKRRYPFVQLMNEIYRVLVLGGSFLSSTPAFPDAMAFWDPTHVNYITEHTFPLYFDNKNRWAEMYGFTGRFEVISQARDGPHLITILKKL